MLRVTDADVVCLPWTQAVAALSSTITSARIVFATRPSSKLQVLAPSPGFAVVHRWSDPLAEFCHHSERSEPTDVTGKSPVRRTIGGDARLNVAGDSVRGVCMLSGP